MSLLRTSVALILASALFTAGCTSTGGTAKSDSQNAFADYPVADILEAGNKALDAGEAERAVYIYMQALEIEQSAETWYRIGVGKARLGDKGYAWTAFKKAVELDPNHAGAQEELGLTYMAMAQPDQAIIHLQKTTELEPKRWRAWNALGVLADMDKRYAQAVEYYHAGLIGAPQSPMLMSNIGYSYYLSGNLQEAASWFGRALLTDPNYQPAVKNLALLYARQGWYDEAVKTFSKVVSKPQAYNDVGYLAMRQGDYEQAHELLTEAIRLSPTYYEKAYENLELVEKQLAAEGKSDPAAAALRSNSDRIVVAEGQEPRKASVTAELLNVRSSPASDADIITHLKAGDKVEVIMTMPDWAFVNYSPETNDSNLTGWVNSRYVGSTDKKSTLAAEPEVSEQEAVAAETQTDAVVAKPGAILGENTADVLTAVATDSPAELTGTLPASVTPAVAPTAKNNTSVSDAPITSKATDDSNSMESVSVSETEVSSILPANLSQPEEQLPAASSAGNAQTPPVIQPDADKVNSTLTDVVVNKVEAVCEPGTQAEKTPQGAGSCIGVASLSADN